jgi:hypothetical protein
MSKAWTERFGIGLKPENEKRQKDALLGSSITKQKR